MEGSLVIVLMMGLPIIFFMVVWAVGTAVRLTFPEPPAPLPTGPAIIRRRLAMRGKAVPVGLREIREDYRWQFSEFGPPHYCYEGFARNCIPQDWIEDLQQRQN